MIDIVGDGQIVLREWTIDSGRDGQREWTLIFGSWTNVFNPITPGGGHFVPADFLTLFFFKFQLKTTV